MAAQPPMAHPKENPNPPAALCWKVRPGEMTLSANMRGWFTTITRAALRLGINRRQNRGFSSTEMLG